MNLQQIAKQLRTSQVRRCPAPCGKLRHHTEADAAAHIAQHRVAHGPDATTYTCDENRQWWHVASRGFHFDSLRSLQRRAAWKAVCYGNVGVEGLALMLECRSASQRQKLLAELRGFGNAGLIRFTSSALPRVVVVDDPGLRRVVRVGLSQYREEQAKLRRQQQKETG